MKIRAKCPVCMTSSQCSRCWWWSCVPESLGVPRHKALLARERQLLQWPMLRLVVSLGDGRLLLVVHCLLLLLLLLGGLLLGPAGR